MTLHQTDSRIGATTLAALRLWQKASGLHTNVLHDVATCGGSLDPLTSDEIDALCEALNAGGAVMLPGDDDISPADTIDAAACLWEAALELLGPIPAAPDAAALAALSPTALALWEWSQREGMGGLRHAVTGWADECHRAWLAAGGLERLDSFDWDFVPAWLAARIEREA